MREVGWARGHRLADLLEAGARCFARALLIKPRLLGWLACFAVLLSAATAIAMQLRMRNEAHQLKWVGVMPYYRYYWPNSIWRPRWLGVEPRFMARGVPRARRWWWAEQVGAPEVTPCSLQIRRFRSRRRAIRWCRVQHALHGGWYQVHFVEDLP